LEELSLEQDRNMPKKQTCPYIQKPMMMNWKCNCPWMMQQQSMMQQPMPYQGGFYPMMEDEYEEEDERAWHGDGKGHHKWDGYPMYGPGWYHHHWDGHKWHGPWHDNEPYNHGWHGKPEREEEE
jgi:hypothetical protein